MSTAVKSPPGAAPDTGADISPAEMFRRIYRLFYNKRFGLWLIFAMALLSLLGALFTQVPAEVRADPAKYASFLESVQPKYRGWTMPLSFLGVFHMFSSWPFRIINILLVLSIIACTTHRLPTLWRNATKPHTHVREGFFDHARTHRSTVVSGDAQALLEEARGKLAHKRFRIIQDDSADGLNLYADRNRWMPLGTAFAHAAFCLILLGVLVTNNTGFHEDQFTVPVGMGPQAVGHGTGLSIEAKSFTDSYHDDGSPMDYASEVVLYKDGQKIKEHTLRVNAALKHDRVMFNQSYFGFAADLTVKDSKGAELMHNGVALQYQTQDETQNYGKTTLPNGMQLYVVAPASGQTDARIGPGQVLVELYPADSNEPVDSQVISQGKPAQVGELQMTFNRERQFTGLMVSKDNGAPLVWLGSLLLVLGMICTMFFRHQRLWIRIHPGTDGNQVRVASPDKHDTLFENEVTRFVDSLGGKDLDADPEPSGAGTDAHSTNHLTTTGSTHA
ncbi:MULTISPECIES: cytochrome c biogenesis protein ResB [unclassified Luteococcus]|uniref:cytochrome c biogenesis protein ResB n=1 Tax=unclassified Luteococcus TaxID=2639923 RepID=UPI00313B8618